MNNFFKIRSLIALFIGIAPYEMQSSSPLSAEPLKLGILTVYDPITTLIDQVVPLPFFNVQAFRAIKSTHHKPTLLRDLKQAVCNDEAYQKTRAYYEYARRELNAIYHNLRHIYGSLLSFINEQRYPPFLFSSRFLTQFKPSPFNINPLPDISQELAFSFAEKEKLLLSRDSELEQLQLNILDLHLLLAFHINELIEQKHKAKKEVLAMSNPKHDDIFVWKRYGETAIRDIRFYECDHSLRHTFLIEGALDHLERKTKEVSTILTFYEIIKNNSFVDKTTDLSTIIQNYKNINDAIPPQTIQEIKAIIKSTRDLCMQFFQTQRVILDKLYKDTEEEARKIEAEAGLSEVINAGIKYIVIDNKQKEARAVKRKVFQLSS